VEIKFKKKGRNQEEKKGEGAAAAGEGKGKGSRNDWLRSVRSHALAALLTIHTRTKRRPGNERIIIKAGAKAEMRGKEKRRRK
jgi:hypothetical protein